MCLSTSVVWFQVNAGSLALGMGMGALHVDTGKKPSRRVDALVDFDALTPMAEMSPEAGDPFAVRTPGAWGVEEAPLFLESDCCLQTQEAFGKHAANVNALHTSVSSRGQPHSQRCTK